MIAYSQCELRKGKQFDVAWISAEFAHPGRYIKIKKDGYWMDGWRVEKVYTTLSADIVEKRARDFTKMATYE